MIRLTFICAIALLAGGGAEPPPPAPAATPATQPTTAPHARPTTRAADAPVAALWYEPSGMRIMKPGEKFEPHRLIAGVWGDGRVVWSNDRATGGGPYRTARIDADTVARLKQSLATVGLFELDRQAWYGPDASITVLAADLGEKRQRLGTWHEPARRDNPLLVIDQRGIYALKPGEVRPEPSPEYAKFLDVWSESRRLIESVVPKDGQPVTALDENVFKLGRDRR